MFVDNSLLVAVIVLAVIAFVAIIAGVIIILILYIKLRAANKRSYCLCLYVVTLVMNVYFTVFVRN